MNKYHLLLLVLISVCVSAAVFVLCHHTLNSKGRSADEIREYYQQKNLFAKDMSDVGIAIDSYIADRDQFPDDIRDSNSIALLSWRVRLLPYIGESALYQRFQLDQPWNSDINKNLIKEIPPFFNSWQCRTKRNKFSQGYTVIQVLKTRRQDFERRIPHHDEIILVESSSPVIWTKPDDINVDETAFPIEVGTWWWERGGYVGYRKGNTDFIPEIFQTDRMYLVPR